MGWCSGTDIFDAVVAEVVNEPGLKTAFKRRLIRILADALENGDWDCQSDSDYWDDEHVRVVFKEKYPDWFKENEDDE